MLRDTPQSEESYYAVSGPGKYEGVILSKDNEKTVHEVHLKAPTAEGNGTDGIWYVV
jgi:hypothetical protein